MKRVLWIIQTLIFYGATLACALLPEPLVRPAGRMTGRFGAFLIPKRRRIAIDNIRQALPAMRKSPDWNSPLQTPEEISREMFGHMGISLLETAIARGKGVIFITAHCGNWELSALSLARHFNATMSVVARRQNNPYINSMVEKMRGRYNNLIIYKDNAFKNIVAVIRRNGIVGLLVDQAVYPSEGALIDFLGRKAWASKAPVLLARKLGTALVPAFIHREGNRHVIDIYPELRFSGDNSESGMAGDVKSYSSAIERQIIRHPADWYWVHRRWKRAGEQSDES